MNAKDTLGQQFAFLYRTAEANLDGMTHAESLRQPQPGGNCANWILGHLAAVQNHVLGLLGEEPVIDHPNLPLGEDQGPITGSEGAVPFDDVRARFLASRDRCLAALGSLDDAALDDGGFTDPFGGSVTRGQLLGILAFHQAYHAGQLGLSRRLAGKPGAIAGPRRSIPA